MLRIVYNYAYFPVAWWSVATIQSHSKSTVLPFVPLSQRVYTFLNRSVTIYVFFLTGTLVGQAIIQVVMSVPNNNNDLPQRNTQSKQPDLSISLEPRGAIHIHDEPTKSWIFLHHSIWISRRHSRS